MPNEKELLEILLKNRGILDKNSRENFLNPSYTDHIHDPFLLKDMEKSCVRIFEAIEAKEKIVIYSDYDCDGIPAAVIVSDLFNKIGYENFIVYIPDRHDEGYGLNIEAIDKFIDDQVKLVITFDLGITAHKEVLKAQSSGIDVIITDHHLPTGVVLPNAFAIINPKQPECNYPDKNLCGAGVAFKLVCGFIKKYGEFFKINNGWEKWLLDMVGVATLADQVPLIGENRVFAYYGLMVLKKAKRPGLVELFKKSSVDISSINEEDITFTLAPKINVASRLDDPMNAFLLLSTNDTIQAKVLSDHLTKINNDRKLMVAHIMKDVKKILSKREDKSVIVIGNKSWKIGVLGIVATKIMEEYKRPAFVWGEDKNGAIRGSCRSFGEVNLVDIMTSLPEGSLLEFGGHKNAGGFSMSADEIHFLEEKLVNVFDGVKDEKEIKGDILIDASIHIDDVNMANYKVIERLAPYGMANPKPTFLFKDITISDIKEFGKNNDHLEILFINNIGKFIKAIAFFKTRESYTRSLTRGERIDLIATFEKSTFLRRTELRLRIVDII